MTAGLDQLHLLPPNARGAAGPASGLGGLEAAGQLDMAPFTAWLAARPATTPPGHHAQTSTTPRNAAEPDAGAAHLRDSLYWLGRFRVDSDGPPAGDPPRPRRA